MHFIPALGIRFRIVNSFTRRRGIFKGLSQDGGQADFYSETSAPLSLIKTLQLNLISARSISLDSAFNTFYKACVYLKKIY